MKMKSLSQVAQLGAGLGLVREYSTDEQSVIWVAWERDLGASQRVSEAQGHAAAPQTGSNNSPP